MKPKAILQKPCLLVADDDPLILFTLVEGLTEAGFEVLQARDGLSALELCKSARPDLALLDIRMPGMDGMELAQQIKAETTVPFLFFSAFGDESNVKQAVSAGAYGYLLKPLSVAAIVPMVRTVLARTREDAHRQARQDQFDSALESNRLIATAAGIIMRDLGMDQDGAFEHMRAQARRKRVKLIDLAQRIVTQGTSPSHS
jgi:two-component system, response regulator PdtaR